MKVWRHNARLRLISELGGKCKYCPETENLTFAHNTPLTVKEDRNRKTLGANKRLVLYRKEHREGKLHLACQSCNNKSQIRNGGTGSEPAEPTNPF
jgi:5-methylcytosine-specific restriction endonuclease McrA